MKSKIMATLEQHISKDIKGIQNTDTYIHLNANLEYFEGYVTAPEAPDIVEMISQIILGKATSIPDARLSCSTLNGNNGLVISTSGKGRTGDAIFIGPMMLNYEGIQVTCGNFAEKHFSGPTIHINHIGYNRSDSKDLITKGAIIQAYNIPKNIAPIIIKDFVKINARNRNEVILEFARSEELTNCYSKDHWVEFYKKQIKESGTTLPGINANAVWTIEKPGNEIEIFGNAHAFRHNHSYISMTMRIARPNSIYKIPYSEY